MMKHRFKIDADDYKLAQAVAGSHLPNAGWRQNVLVAVQILAGLPFFALVLILSTGQFTKLMQPEDVIRWSYYCSLASIALMFPLRQLESSVLYRRLAPSLLELDYEITERALVVSGEYTREEYSWNGVYDIQNDQTRIFIVLKSFQVLVIPAKSFGTYADFDLFYSALIKCVRKL